MENSNTINNDEIKPKKVYYEAQKKVWKEYHERNKDNEECKQRNRDKAKRA